MQLLAIAVRKQRRIGNRTSCDAVVAKCLARFLAAEDIKRKEIVTVSTFALLSLSFICSVSFDKKLR
jgi:hypothetical protein